MKKPENLGAIVSLEDLKALADEATAEINKINGKDGDLDKAELDELEAVLGIRDEILARSGEVEQEAAALVERREALRQRAEAQAEAEATEGAEEGAEVVEGVDAIEAEAAAAEAANADAELVTASAATGTKRSTVAGAASKAPAPKAPPAAPKAPLTVITAAGGLQNFGNNEALHDMSQVTAAFLDRISGRGSNDPKMQAGVYQMSANHTKQKVATIKRKEREFAVDRDMGLEAQMRVIMDASSESQFAGGSVIAAGGWCAPSETIYELFSYHTNEGLIDIPEVTARRGGIQFTKGPDFMTIFADPDASWIMTETQAEAGSFTKPCYALECPPFEEVRLDAIGFCATSPLLTEAAYPELVRQVLDMLGTGHARRKSAETIKRIVANITTVINWAEVNGNVFSGTADVLAGLELQANRIRQALAMSPSATIEGFAPYWVRGAMRNELSRSLGIENRFLIKDSDVDSWLALRGISLQYVYDYQMLNDGALGTAGGTLNGTGWPTKVEFTLYPAGAYTRLVNDVINLNAVYDHDLLTQNEYTAAFVEEGIAIANTRGYGVRIEFALNYNGFTGASRIGENLTFAA